MNTRLVSVLMLTFLVASMLSTFNISPVYAAVHPDWESQAYYTDTNGNGLYEYDEIITFVGDDFYVDDELIIPFKRSDGKKAEFIYYKIPTQNNLIYKFFTPEEDASFIIQKLEEYDIL